MPDPTSESAATGADDELAELRSLASRVRPEPPAWETPPDELWDRIAAETELTRDHSDPDATLHHLDPTRPRRDATRSPASHRGRRLPWLLAAAAVAAALGVGALIVGLARSENTTVVAAVSLEPLGDSGEGRAELVDRDGSLQLRLDVAGVDAGDGFLEVWVIDPDITRLISLGPLRSDGRYDLPASLDPEAFPIVDVSLEPIDGNPAHSGDSVLRGQLEF